ncbi:MAG: hypothetical protein ABJG68_14600 [Crocinitomicaceae bacterium]
MKCRTLYNEKSYEEAYNCYKQAPETKMDLYMCAILSRHLKDLDAYSNYKKQLLKNYKKDPVAYEYAAILVGEQSPDYLKLLNKGLKQDDKSEALLVMKTNFYVTQQENEKALKSANVLVDLAPKKVEYLVCRGAIHQHLENEEKAIADFKKIIELSPKNFTANYGIGSIYFNQAADLNDQANATQDNELYKKLSDQATAKMKEALPFLQRAYLTNKKDEGVINALKTCYLRLGMTERYQQLMQDY